MMELFEAIKARCSYRGRYEDTPVSREELKRIMEAGLAAPSGCNMQTTKLVGIDDPELIRQLGGMLRKPNFATAPAAIVVLAKEEISYGGASYHVQDYSAAIENMLLAITALGYASCWVEGYVTRYPEVAAAITAAVNAPAGFSAVAYLPVGNPAEEYRYVQKKAFEERAAFNSFDGGIK